MNEYENFGKRGRDKVTGFEGVITAITYYMYGCAQVLLIPTVDKEGKKREGEWFDEGRIDIFEEIVKPESVKADKNGCEHREHPSN